MSSYEGRDERAGRLDQETASTAVVERARDETAPEAPPLERGINLGVDERENARAHRVHDESRERVSDEELVAESSRIVGYPKLVSRHLLQRNPDAACGHPQEPRRVSGVSRRLFKDDAFDFNAKIVLGGVYRGAGDVGEALSTIDRIHDGDSESWHWEWLKSGERVLAVAEECEATGHLVSAREGYLRASAYLYTSTRSLDGTRIRRASSRCGGRIAERGIDSASSATRRSSGSRFPMRGRSSSATSFAPLVRTSRCRPSF